MRLAVGAAITFGAFAMPAKLIASATVQACDPSTAAIVAFVPGDGWGTLTAVKDALALWRVAIVICLTTTRILSFTMISGEASCALALARRHLALTTIFANYLVTHARFTAQTREPFWTFTNARRHLASAGVLALDVVTCSFLTRRPTVACIAFALVADARSLGATVCIGSATPFDSRFTL